MHASAKTKQSVKPVRKSTILVFTTTVGLLTLDASRELTLDYVIDGPVEEQMVNRASNTASLTILYNT